MWTYFQEEDNPGREQTALEAHSLGLDTVGAPVCSSHSVWDSGCCPFSLVPRTSRERSKKKK